MLSFFAKSGNAFSFKVSSNLRLFKNFKGGLTDRSEIELTKYEMLLENHLKNKYKEIDEWLNNLMIKNGITKY